MGSAGNATKPVQASASSIPLPSSSSGLPSARPASVPVRQGQSSKAQGGVPVSVSAMPSSPAPAQSAVPLPSVSSAAASPISVGGAPLTSPQVGAVSGALPGMNSALPETTGTLPSMTSTTSAAGDNTLAANNDIVAELTGPTNIKAMLTSWGAGIGFALLAALILFGADFWLEKMVYRPSFGYVNGATLLQDAFEKSVDHPNLLFGVFVYLLTTGSGGAFSVKTWAESSHSNLLGARLFGFSGINFVGVALLVGAAFGMFIFARKAMAHNKWAGAAGSAIVGVATGLVYLLVAAIGSMTYFMPLGDLASAFFNTNQSVNSHGTFETTVSTMTWPTFVVPFLLAILGAFVGYALGEYAGDAGNVFAAAWRWMHRTRGFVRTIAEAGLVYFPVFVVLGICLDLLGAVSFGSKYHMRGIELVFDMLFLFPNNVLGRFVGSSLGGTFYRPMIGSTLHTSFFGTIGSLGLPASLMSYGLGFIVFLLCTLYLALRASARNLQDRSNAVWQNTWKSPAVMAAIWIVLLVCSMSVSSVKMNPYMGIGSAMRRFGITLPSLQTSLSGFEPWYVLVAAAWMFAIEALAMSVGPMIVTKMPSLMTILKGGLVQPVLVDVAARVNALDGYGDRNKAAYIDAGSFVARLQAHQVDATLGNAKPNGMAASMFFKVSSGNPAPTTTPATGSLPGLGSLANSNPMAGATPLAGAGSGMSGMQDVGAQAMGTADSDMQPASSALSSFSDSSSTGPAVTPSVSAPASTGAMPASGTSASPNLAATGPATAAPAAEHLPGLADLEALRNEQGM